MSSLDPSRLATPGSGTITGDKRCRKCDYPLMGLAAGGKCPECGTPIPLGRGRLASGDNLTDAPAKYLRRLTFSLGLLAVSAVLLGIGVVAVRTASSWQGPAMLTLAAGMWIGSVFLVTIRRPLQDTTVRDSTLDDTKWLAIVRYTQFAWLVAAFLGILRFAAAQQSWGIADFLYGSYAFFILAAFALTVPVLSYLAAIAEWAGDEGLAGRLRGSGWGILVGGVGGGLLFVIAPLMGPLGGFFTLIAVLLMVVYFLSLLLAVISIVQVAGLSAQAIATNAAAEARNVRVAERKEREMRELVERQKAALDAPGPDVVDPAKLDPSDAFIENTPQFKAGGHRIESTDSDEIFELEPDDDTSSEKN